MTLRTMPTAATRPNRQLQSHPAMGPASLKMKDLERATGVSRETIRFYIHAGLLPEPQRLGRNVARYDSAFIERIRLIKELQQKRFLPLRVIRTLFEGEGGLAPVEVQTLLDLDRQVFRAGGIDLQRAPVRLAEVARRSGLAAAEIRQLASLGAIAPSTRRGTLWLSDPDVRIVELWARLRAAGFTDALGFGPQHARLYVETVRGLVAEELRVFARGVTGKTDRQQFTAMAQAAIEILNQLIGALRTAFLLRLTGASQLPEALGRPTRIQSVARSDGRPRTRAPGLSHERRGKRETDAS